MSDMHDDTNGKFPAASNRPVELPPEAVELIRKIEEATKATPSHQTKIEEVRAAIIRANPEVVKLDTGCRVLISDRACSNDAFDVVPAHSKSVCTVLAYYPGGRIVDDYEGDTLTVWCDDWAITRSWGEHGSGWGNDGEVPEYEIIGRPIRLADVLLTLSLSIADQEEYERAILILLSGVDEGAAWKLLQDDLDEQRPACIAYIRSRLP